MPEVTTGLIPGAGCSAADEFKVSTASTEDPCQAISSTALLVPEILQGIGHADESFGNTPITADEALSADLVAQLFGAGTIRGLERSWRGGDGSIDVGGLSLFALQDEKRRDGDAEMKRPGGDVENNARVYSLCGRERWNASIGRYVGSYSADSSVSSATYGRSHSAPHPPIHSSHFILPKR